MIFTKQELQKLFLQNQNQNPGRSRIVKLVIYISENVIIIILYFKKSFTYLLLIHCNKISFVGNIRLLLRIEHCITDNRS